MNALKTETQDISANTTKTQIDNTRKQNAPIFI
jgi:hypothetical protein